jgi:hypothetical protein
MKQLEQWLDQAKASGIRKVFIDLHNPVFCRSGMGPIPEAQNPHKILASLPRIWTSSFSPDMSTRPRFTT